METMDATENGARRVPRGVMARMAIEAEWDRLERQAQAAVRAHGVPTGHAVPMAHLERLDPPVSPALPARKDHPDRPGPLVRRVSAVRRATRVTREILGRLVKRANL